MTLDNIKDKFNRVVYSIEYDTSPFIGMKSVSADDIRELWLSSHDDFMGMFEGCTTLETVELPEMMK